MALRKITIQIEELHYQPLRQESFDKHIPISELIRIHLEESKLPISHAKFFPGGLSQEEVDRELATTAKGKEVATWLVTAPEPSVFDDEVDTRETGRCSLQNESCRNEGYLYEVTYPSEEGERRVKRFLCDFHVKKTRDGGMDVAEL